LLISITALCLVVFAAAAPIPDPAADPDKGTTKSPKLPAPQLHKVRWQTFAEQVNYVVIDAKRRPWFLVKDGELEHPQYVCPEVPGAHLMLPGNYRTIGVDIANRFWLATNDGLFYFDLNNLRRYDKEIKGLFSEDPDTGWPMYHPGQLYFDHSSARVYCHDYTGMHVFDGKRWTFHKWPAEILGSTGKVDHAQAGFQAVEGPGGIAIFWAAGDRLKGFWTHDGKLWRHYSSKSNSALRDITAVIPMSRGSVLVCVKSHNAFMLDLSSGASAAVPETKVIINHLMRLGHKDAKVRDEAKKVVREMVLADAKKVTEIAGFITDAKLRKQALAVIADTRRGGGKRSDIPPGPKRPLRGARLIVRNSRGEALLTWTVAGRKKMGILHPNGKIVPAPQKMSTETRRRLDQVHVTATDGSIIIVTRRMWKWNGREFTLLCSEWVTAKTELLGIDRFGRIFMEASSNDYRRAMCDPRYKGVEGAGVVGENNKPSMTDEPDFSMRTRM